MLSAWTFARRGIALGSGLSLGAFALPAMAASIGDARTLSHLGEPLRVEIPVQSETRIEPDCVRVAPLESANEDIPWLRGAHAVFADQGGTNRRLIITTPRPINTPVLMLGIHIACGVQIRREYALLLDPPGLQELAAAPAAEPEIRATTREPEAKGLHRAVEGDSAASIAADLLPGRRAAQTRLARQIVAANAASLGSKGSIRTPFPPGALIAIPEFPPAPPRATSPVPAASASAATDMPPTRARHGKPQLRIGGGPESGLQMSLSLGQYRELKETERDRLRTEMQLLSMLDERIATQLELSDRLRRLETLQEQLRGDATRLDTELQRQGQSIATAASAPSPLEASGPAAQPAPPATLSAPRAPVTPPPVVREEQSVLQSWWFSGALLLLALALAAWLLQRRRRQPIPSLDASVADVTRSTPVPHDNLEELFEPLNEADIWPERGLPVDTAGAAQPERSPAAADGPPEGALGPMSMASLGPASVLQIDDSVEEHDSAVELAEIMMSFGRVQGAAQTLADFIRGNPKQAVKPWIKLLEVYRAANMRTEFDGLCAQLNKTFNVKPVGWDDFEGALKAPESLENLSHIAQKLSECWGKRECQAYLHELLRDNRQGTRQGFPLAIIDEILLLLAILESQLGPYRPEESQSSEAEPAATPPETVRVGGDQAMLAPLDLSIGDAAAPPASGTAVDFDLDLMDLSKTLHINLDELEPSETHQSLDELDGLPAQRER